MKCIFCDAEFSFSGGNFECPRCHSYYQFQRKEPEFHVYHAYPHMDVRKNFQSRVIRLKGDN